MGSLEFFINLIFLLHFGPWVVLTSNRNEYKEYHLGGKGNRGVGLTNLQPSYTDCLKILGASTYWNSSGLYNCIEIALTLSFCHMIKGHQCPAVKTKC
jgi:hypothetical protein